MIKIPLDDAVAVGFGGSNSRDSLASIIFDCGSQRSRFDFDSVDDALFERYWPGVISRFKLLSGVGGRREPEGVEAGRTRRSLAAFKR